MSLYLLLDDSGRGRSTIEMEESNGTSVDITNFEELERLLEEPRNYVVENEVLVYSPVFRPSQYHVFTDGVWVLNTKYLNECRELIWEKIKEERDRKKFQGFLFTIPNVGSYWIHSDMPSRIQHLALLLCGIASILGIFPFPVKEWKTLSRDENNSPIKITLSVNLVFALFGAELTFESLLFDKAEEHRLAVMQSNDPLNYGYGTGWPDTFEERV